MQPAIQEYMNDILVAPQAGRQFLIKEIGLAVIQNFIVVYASFSVVIQHKHQLLHCAPLTSIWIFVLCFANLSSLYCKVRCLPRLFKLIITKQNILMMILKQILSSEEYLKNMKISVIIVCTYLFGFFLLIADLFGQYIQEDQCMDELSMRLIYLSFMIKLWLSSINETRRLNQKSLESLRNLIINTKYNKAIDQNNQIICSICLEEFTHHQMISIYQCKAQHIFHINCIKEWILQKNSNKSCPFCRDLPLINLQD